MMPYLNIVLNILLFLSILCPKTLKGKKKKLSTLRVNLTVNTAFCVIVLQWWCFFQSSKPRRQFTMIGKSSLKQFNKESSLGRPIKRIRTWWFPLFILLNMLNIDICTRSAGQATLVEWVNKESWFKLLTISQTRCPGRIL